MTYPYGPSDKPRPQLLIDQDLPPPSKEEMARRLSRDAALQHWHTTPSIKVPFEEWWASLPKLERGDPKGFSRDIREK